MKLKILGIPKPKQSARFRSVKGKNGKTFMASYQKKEVKDREANIKLDAISQLPKDFVPYDCPIGAKVLYVFPLLSSFSKKKKNAIMDGEVIHKDTKPDITDNLNKGLFDALEGVVFVNDSRVCKIEAEKIYGFTPRIEIEFYKL